MKGQGLGLRVRIRFRVAGSGFFLSTFSGAAHHPKAFKDKRINGNFPKQGNPNIDPNIL